MIQKNHALAVGAPFIQTTLSGDVHTFSGCGNKFTGRPYYGKKETTTSGVAVAFGAIIGCAGGVPGMILGALIRAACGQHELHHLAFDTVRMVDRPTALRCKFMFQCDECLRTWIKRQ
jgi:hypothetical protein